MQNRTQKENLRANWRFI